MGRYGGVSGLIRKQQQAIAKRRGVPVSTVGLNNIRRDLRLRVTHASEGMIPGTAIGVRRDQPIDKTFKRARKLAKKTSYGKGVQKHRQKKGPI